MQTYKKIFVLALCVFFGAQVLLSQTASANWNLTFQDEFNGTGFNDANYIDSGGTTHTNANAWITTYPGGGRTANTEMEWYVDNAFTFTGSALQINTTNTSGGGTCSCGTSCTVACSYTSGIICSQGKFSQAYGYYEMRAWVKGGLGTWPAFWMIPVNTPPWPQVWELDYELGFAGLSTGETDNSLHYGSFSGLITSDGINPGRSLTDGFHIYAFDWEPGSIKYYLDGVLEYTITSQVPTDAGYMFANLAISDSAGGASGWSFIGTPDITTKNLLASNSLPMQIDYVRVYKNSSSGCYATIPSYSTIPSLTCTSDTIAPSVPANLTATAASFSQINLSWSASTDNIGGTGVANYNIYRNGSLLTSTSGTTYQDTGLTASTLYTYKVSAVDGVGNESAQSLQASATTAASPTLPATYAFTTVENPLSATYWTKPLAATVLQATGGVAKATVNATYNAALWTGNIFANDQWTQATITAIDSNENWNLWLRGNAATGNGYVISIGSSSWSFGKVAGGVYALLGASQSRATTTGTVVRFRVVGTTLSVSFDGGTTWNAYTISNSSYTSGNPGLELDDTTVAADNWSADNNASSDSVAPAAPSGLSVQ